MRIRVVGQAGELLFPFKGSSPWVKFRDNLITRKDVLVTQKFGQNIDALICHGYSKNAISEAKNSKIPKNKMILILWEPPVVNPKTPFTRIPFKFWIYLCTLKGMGQEV